MSEITVGTIVKLSDYALQRDRDYWQGLGDYTRKNRAKAHYEAQRARRGEVTALLEADLSRGTSNGYTIKWADGTTSTCVRSFVELA